MGSSFDWTPEDWKAFAEYSERVGAEDRFTARQLANAAQMQEIDRKAYEALGGASAGYRALTPPDPPIPEVEPISMRGIINGVLLGSVAWLLIAAVVWVSVYHSQIAAWLARWDG